MRSFLSLPQKDASGHRSDDDSTRFKHGLEVMGMCYASVSGTVVVQCTTVGAPPAAEGAEGAGRYNLTPYAERGWCTFEEGAARLVVAHLTQLPGAGGAPLPERLQSATRAPKLVRVGADGAWHAERVDEKPRQVLSTTSRAIADATRTRFTGKGDRADVQRLLADIDWIIKTSFDQLLELMAGHEAEPDPKDVRAPGRGSDVVCQRVGRAARTWLAALVRRREGTRALLHLQQEATLQRACGAAVTPHDPSAGGGGPSRRSMELDVELVRT